jgi:hypothetical protein
MLRYSCILSASLLLLILLVVCPCAQAQKKETAKRFIIISGPTCDGDNMVANGNLPADGSNDSGYAIFGLLFDPDDPDNPTLINPPAGMDGSGTAGTASPWHLDLGNLQSKAGWMLRVVDSVTGDSKDCVFNVTMGTPVPPPIVIMGDLTLTDIVMEVKNNSTPMTSVTASARSHGGKDHGVYAVVVNENTRKAYMCTITRVGRSNDFTIQVNIPRMNSGETVAMHVGSIYPKSKDKKEKTK